MGWDAARMSDWPRLRPRASDKPSFELRRAAGVWTGLGVSLTAAGFLGVILLAATADNGLPTGQIFGEDGFSAQLRFVEDAEGTLYRVLAEIEVLGIATALGVVFTLSGVVLSMQDRVKISGTCFLVVCSAPLLLTFVLLAWAI